MPKFRFTRWVLKRPKIHGKFKHLNFTPKTKTAVHTVLKENRALKKVFSVKAMKAIGITVAAGGTLGLATQYVHDYIQSNSGCFLKDAAGSTLCKVRVSSCCQKEEVDDVPFCEHKDAVMRENAPPLAGDSACDQFDEEEEKSCCRYCDCRFFDCQPNETMECQRPTVGEAISHFAQTTASNALSTLLTLFPFLAYVGYALVGIAFAWLLVYVLFRS